VRGFGKITAGKIKNLMVRFVSELIIMAIVLVIFVILEVIIKVMN